MAMKKNTIITFFSFCCFCFFLNKGIAQTAVKINGQVLDAGNKPISAASVHLLQAKDSIIIKTMVTNDKGLFEFSSVNNGDYFITIKALGYKNYSGSFIKLAGKETVLQPIMLEASAGNELKEVIVTATKPLIEQKIDRTVVNVDAQITNTGTNTLEVLEKTPGIMIDENGNITFKGKTNVLVLIDDKPTYLSASDLAAYLKSLPSSAIEKIELMENPPAKYDAAGNAGVINIRTKKNKTKGFNSNLTANYNQGFYWRYNGSTNLNYRSGKTNLFANIASYNYKTNRELIINRNYFDANNNPLSSFLQHSYFTNTGHNANLKAGMDYSLSPKTTIGFVLTGSLSKSDQYLPNNSYLYNNTAKLDSFSVANNYEKNRFNKTGININYNKQIDSNGKVLSIDADYVKYSSKGKQIFNNSMFYPGGALIDTQSTYNNLPSVINIYSLKTDFTLPLKGKTKLEIGLKTSYVMADNGAYYFNIVNGSVMADNNNTNHFLYNENINAAYVNFNKTFQRISVQTGLRLENTNGFGHQLGNTAVNDSSFQKHYNSVFPTLYISYKLDTAGTNLLNFSLGRRIGRPYYQDLNPFVFFVNKYSYFTGNPYLQPQFNNNYKVSYQYKSILTASLVYDYATDIQIETIQQKGDVFISRTGNIGQRIFMGVSLNISLKPYKWWNMNIYSEFNHNNFSGQLYNGYIDEHSTWVYVNGSNQFAIAKSWSGELSFFYIGSQKASQFTRVPTGQLNMGIQKKIWNDKGTVKFSVRDIFHSFKAGGDITNVPNAFVTFNNILDTQVATIAFTYNFGKQYDIKARKNNSTEDTEANRIKN